MRHPFALAIAVATLPTVVYAQEPGSSAAPASLSSGTWTYDVVAIAGDEQQRIGTRALEIAATTHEGRPAWLIIESSWTAGTAMTDSLLLNGESMRPIFRRLHLGGAMLDASYSADSVRGTMRRGVREVAFAASLPRDAVVNAGMLEVLMRVSAVRAGWTARADQVVVGPSGQVHVTATVLSVEGTDTVAVPAGSFPAWIVSARSDQAAQRFWLSRDGNWVVRSSATLEGLPGARIETVLTGVAVDRR